MKKLNKKGFTIVELVIVIAVIAILAGVLIPTFTSVATNAQKSAAMQECKNLFTEYLSENADKMDGTEEFYIADAAAAANAKYYFRATGASFDAEVLTNVPTVTSGYTWTAQTGKFDRIYKAVKTSNS